MSRAPWSHFRFTCVEIFPRRYAPGWAAIVWGELETVRQVCQVCFDRDRAAVEFKAAFYAAQMETA